MVSSVRVRPPGRKPKNARSGKMNRFVSAARRNGQVSMGKEEIGVVTKPEKELVENEIDEFGRQLIITIHLVSAYSPTIKVTLHWHCILQIMYC
jgi:hypothetical protein